MKVFRSVGKISFILAFSCLALVIFSPLARAYPVQFTDAQGRRLTVSECPRRVVSLVPAITEIIFALGAGDALAGITYHDSLPPETTKKEIVGGFFAPSLTRIEKIQPEVIFLSGLQKKVRKKFASTKCILIELETRSIADIYRNVKLLGAIFQQPQKAAQIVHQIKGELELISQKTAKIPKSKRQRVIRLMGRNRVMTPGDDSFQNEYIRAAGGIPPRLNRSGKVVDISAAEWRRFNPQVIYGCGGDRQTARKFFSQPGWKEVAAVKNGKIFYFPCALTCRASVQAGHFVSWLASTIYADEFLRPENLVLKEKIINCRPVKLDLDYIKRSRRVESRIYDFVNKTLIIDFKEPMQVVSSLEGCRSDIHTVGNHYSPPPCWSLGHRLGLNKLRQHIYRVLRLSPQTSSFLFTGADMDHLAIKSARFRDLVAFALTTAGVKSNAGRMSADEGRFYEPGTINIIILTNMRLTPRAMTRAIISATEAKTAALQDLDVRSAAHPRINQATGTGTDNIIVVEGRGPRIENTGGHSKMGELIARAVYDGVKDAVYRQNGLIAGRNIFQRLQERRIGLYELISGTRWKNRGNRSQRVGELEELLLQPRYAAWVASALARSDARERGLLTEPKAQTIWGREIAEEIAGKKIDQMVDLVSIPNVPPEVKMALNALLNGIYFKAPGSRAAE